MFRGTVRFALPQIPQQPLERLLVGVVVLPPREIADVPRPAEVARDLYRTDYPDIPAPLWRPFWEAEVLEPCAHFAARFAAISRRTPANS